MHPSQEARTLKEYLPRNFCSLQDRWELIQRQASCQEGVSAQTKQALENVKAIVEAAGTTLDNVLRVGVYLRDINDFGEMNKMYLNYFSQNQPARSTIQAALVGQFLVEVDCIALKN